MKLVLGLFLTAVVMGGYVALIGNEAYEVYGRAKRTGKSVGEATIRTVKELLLDGFLPLIISVGAVWLILSYIDYFNS